MTEVSECSSATEQRNTLSLHCRKRSTSLEDNRSQKIRAVQLTWSTPQFLECSRLGSHKSASATDASQASARQHKDTRAVIRALRLDFPSAVPNCQDLAVAPSAAQLSKAVPSLAQPLRSQVTAPMQVSREGSKARAAISPASQHFGMWILAEAEPPRSASAPARVPLAALKPGVLTSAPTRRHRGTERKPMGTTGHAYSAPSEQACQGPQPQPGIAANRTHAASLQWGSATAEDTQLTSERSASAAASAVSSRAANATQTMLQMWTNPIQPPVQTHLPSLEKLACGNTRSLRPNTITKAQLDTARPLQQVSRQFVPLVCGRTVAIMDQHAAAERIRLEQLQHEVFGENGYPKQRDSVMLPSAQLLQLSPAELQMLQHHRAHVEAWGWQLAHPECSHATGAVVTHAAVVLGTTLNSTELQSYLQQLKQTNGVARVPQAVHRLLVSKACHSAIRQAHTLRFGDVLSAEHCKQLVQALRKTVSWHCCAHGRPTIVPLVDLAHLQSLLQTRWEQS